jgi:hypothetical protein
MATIKCNVKSKSVRENYTGKNNHGVTGSPTNCRTPSLATAGRSLELRPNTMAFAATFTSLSSRPAAKSRRLYLRPAELLSSATESPRDGAKILAAIVEMAKADTDRFGCSAAQMRNRWPSVMSACAAVELRSISTARKVGPEWSDHSARTLMHTELCSAQTDACWQGHNSSATTRFVIRGPVHGWETKEMGKKTMNPADRNRADPLASHQSRELGSAQNVPTSGERGRHPAKLANVEMAIAIQRPRFRQARPSRRMEIRAEVHCRSEEGTALQRASRRGGRARVERTPALRSDSAGSRTRADGGIRGPNVRSALRFQTRSIHRGPRGILCGDLRCD